MEANEKSDKKLYRNLYVVTGVFLFVMLFAAFAPSFTNPKGSGRRGSSVSTPTKAIDPRILKIKNLESTQRSAEEKISSLEERIVELIESNREVLGRNKDLREKIDLLRKEGVEQLEKVREEFSSSNSLQGAEGFEGSPRSFPEERRLGGEYPLVIDSFKGRDHSFSCSEDPFSGQNETQHREKERVLSPRVFTFSMAHGQGDSLSRITRHVDTHIPAGTTVRALLVSGADVPCGVYSTSDPHPMKLRILDNGHLPRGVDVKLKGSIILASARADLSQKRVLVRLERLTKVMPGGAFTETQVAGYVNGYDGGFGIRGRVVDQACAHISNAAIAGFFGGIANTAGAILNARNFPCGYNCCGPCGLDADGCSSCGGCQTSGLRDIASLDVAERSTLCGAQSALDRISDYWIKRAEQIQPVVVVPAGQIVDVTFTEGFSLGDLDTQERIRRCREKAKVKARESFRREKCEG